MGKGMCEGWMGVKTKRDRQTEGGDMGRGERKGQRDREKGARDGEGGRGEGGWAKSSEILTKETRDTQR